jgi:hypothetical protein
MVLQKRELYSDSLKQILIKRYVPRNAAKDNKKNNILSEFGTSKKKNNI